MDQTKCVKCRDGFTRVDQRTPGEGQRCMAVFRSHSGGMHASLGTWQIDVFTDRQDERIWDFHLWKACCWAPASAA
jgi:hypothetical protein